MDPAVLRRRRRLPEPLPASAPLPAAGREETTGRGVERGVDDGAMATTPGMASPYGPPRYDSSV